MQTWFMTTLNIQQKAIGKKHLLMTIIKKPIIEWFPENKNKPVLFYVHTPFCEQLCNFCLCSKEITSDYEKVKDYLYKYLSKELDLLEELLVKNKINFNFKEIYFGGGSPTY